MLVCGYWGVPWECVVGQVDDGEGIKVFIVSVWYIRVTYCINAPSVWFSCPLNVGNRFSPLPFVRVRQRCRISHGTKNFKSHTRQRPNIAWFVCSMGVSSPSLCLHKSWHRLLLAIISKRSSNTSIILSSSGLPKSAWVSSQAGFPLRRWAKT